MAGTKPGPRPQPTNLVLLRGNPGKRTRPEEPKPAPVVDTKPPAGMSADAEKLWKRLAPELSRVGLLTIADTVALESLCELYSLRCAALRSIKRGRGYVVLTADRAHGGEPRRHPALLILKQFDDSFRAWAKEFGMTPSARVGLPGPGGGDGDEDDDLLD